MIFEINGSATRLKKFHGLRVFLFFVSQNKNEISDDFGFHKGHRRVENDSKPKRATSVFAPVCTTQGVISERAPDTIPLHGNDNYCA